MRIRIKNKKRFGVVLSIVLVLIAMISGTYSLFYRESIAQSKEDYTTGILNIVAKSKSDNINLNNALPMTDEEGAQSEPYVFNIENVGNLDYNFKIRLLSTSENPINPQYIKLKIDDGEVTTLSALTNSVIKDNITLKAKETMDVSIRIWLASNTPNTEIGKSFNSKIVTEGQAVYTQVNNEDGTLSNSEHIPFRNLAQHITNLYNSAEKTMIVSKSDSSDNTVTTNYNYATEVNLMNDRLGGTTESLDGGNIRYYGGYPHNYIDIGDKTSDNKVVLWRIIGVFDGNVRIVKKGSSYTGSYSYDTSASNVNGGRGINEWSQADLMKLLNPGYEDNRDQICTRDSNNNLTCNEENGLVNNSLWWNSESGTCYNNWSNITTECDFTSKGLSNSAKKYVIDQIIYLGGIDTGDIYVNEAYVKERENDLYYKGKPHPPFPDNGNQCYLDSYCTDEITRTSLWKGKVALLYPSDFGYAADFMNSSCNNKKLTDYSCEINRNWLVGGEEVLITPSSSDASITWRKKKNAFPFLPAGSAQGVEPVLTLSSETLIEPDGDGSSNNPYVIKYD